MPAKDTLFANPLGDIDKFKFNKAVVDVFPDMLRRSVPGYESIITQSALLASRHVQAHTHLYDLGSSLGATALSMRDALRHCSPEHTAGCEIHAIDSSPDMVAASRQLIRDADLPQEFNLGERDIQAEHEIQGERDIAGNASKTDSASNSGNSNNSESANVNSNNSDSADGKSNNSESANGNSNNSGSPNGNSNNSDSANRNGAVPIIVHEADLETYAMANASVVAMNFTLQFIDVEARELLMTRIADALVPNGVFILSEKVCFSDPVVNELHIDMYHAFKRANGYSALEVSQKRTALENVLVPDTLSTHQERLMKAGFSHVSVWFQCFNFASLIAIKA